MYTAGMFTSHGGVVAAGTLASTGIQALAWVVAVFTLIFAGLAVVKLIPRGGCY